MMFAQRSLDAVQLQLHANNGNHCTTTWNSECQSTRCLCWNLMHTKQGQLAEIMWNGHIYLYLCVFEGKLKRLLSHRRADEMFSCQTTPHQCVQRKQCVARNKYAQIVIVSLLLFSQSVLRLCWSAFFACNDFMMINDKNDDCWWRSMIAMMLIANDDDDDCKSRWSETHDFHGFFTPSR